MKSSKESLYQALAQTNLKDKGVHSGAIYRDLGAKKVTEADIARARESDKPWSFTEAYVKPVMRMTKAAFVIAYKATIGAVVNKLSQVNQKPVLILLQSILKK